ncbi:hypothetical protein CRYUN_Cryun13aG0093300 [Craigia yunnanensis]
MEVELRAQAIARSRILEFQSDCGAKSKPLPMMLPGLRSNSMKVDRPYMNCKGKWKRKIENYTPSKWKKKSSAWAKEDLLREQNEEMATFRRERDHSEAERAQHIKQIHDLQKHVQEKERQLIELQEQHFELTARLIARRHQAAFPDDMERLHLHTIHQLQLELADARERKSSYTDESHISQANSKDLSQFGQNNGNQVDSNGSGATNANTGVILNGASDNVQSFASAGNAPTPGVPNSVASHVGHYSMPAMSSIQQWQKQQTSSEGFQLSAQNPLPPSQTSCSSRLSGSYKPRARAQFFDIIVLDSINASYLVDPQPEPSLRQVSSRLHDELRLGTLEQSCESKEQNILNMNNHVLEDHVLTEEEASNAASPSPPDTSGLSVNFSETTINNGTGTILPEKSVSIGQTNILISAKTSEIALLDERSLLACIVRMIPTGDRIRISSTLPNRLGKMLAPLHWHDYKKKYGKLDDFVASHPELFVIEGYYIQLQEGAQEMIAATAAVAKIAAATATLSPYSSFLPSVSVTPMAQPNRLKKVLPSIDSNHVKNENAVFKEYAAISKNVADDHSQLLVMQNQHPNGICFGVAGGLSNVKILSKSIDPTEINGANFERSSATSVESKASGHGRSISDFVGKQQGRATGAALSSRRQ